MKSATTTTLERPSTSPSPRQSYFERYPTRNGKGKEKASNVDSAVGASAAGFPVDQPQSLSSKSSIDGMASARAKAARERAKALNSRLNASANASVNASVQSDQDGPSASASSSKTPSPVPGPAHLGSTAVAFPTVDDSSSHDDDDRHLAAPAPSLTGDPKRYRQLSEVSSSSNVRIVSAGSGGGHHHHKGHHREKSSGGHYRPPITSHTFTPSAGVGGGVYLNRPTQQQQGVLPRSQAFHHLPYNNSLATLSGSSSSRAGIAPTPDLLPFIRTSTSSTYTQTTLADQDPEFVSTPQSSVYRADGVLVAGLSSGLGVETMDALVQGMNGGTDTTDDTDYISSMFGGRKTASSKKDRRGVTLAGSSSSSSGFGGMTKLKYHPLYHPPLPQPPDGVALGTPKAKSRGEGSSTTTTEEEQERSAPASAYVSSEERDRPEEDHGRDRHAKKVGGGDPNAFASSHHLYQQHHRDRDRPATAKSDVTIKHGSRGTLFDEVEFPTRKAHSRPTTREKEHRSRSGRHRVRGSRDLHYPPHRQKKHAGGGGSRASSSSSSPREETRELPPSSPLDLSSPQSTPVVDRPPQQEPPKLPTVVPSISDIIRAHAPAYAARPKRIHAAPPSSFAGYVASASSTMTHSRKSSLVEEEEEVTGRSSIDSVTAE
ncbi:hypothetical protein FRB90_006041, partial [Tulasnella sp. 427]